MLFACDIVVRRCDFPIRPRIFRADSAGGELTSV